jgi:hypothetical protein
MSKTVKKEPRGSDPDIAFSFADIAAIQNMAVQKAKEGDMRAATLVERIWRRRRRTVTIDLPPVDNAGGLAKAQAAVIGAAAAGRITPREGVAFAAMLDYRRRALDTVEFEGRLRELEDANVERNGHGGGDNLAALIEAAAAGKPGAR